MIAEAHRHSEITALYGAQFGLTGLIDDRMYDLFSIAANTLDDIRTSPGSVLGSSRRPLAGTDDEAHSRVLRRRNVRYFFYTGGNGSMDTALRFHRLAREIGYELNVIGIPKTIDNDLVQTDHTPATPRAAGSLRMRFATSEPTIELCLRRSAW